MKLHKRTVLGIVLAAVMAGFIWYYGQDSKAPAPAPVQLSCQQPAFLHPGDKVALLSPSYYTPMENVDTAAMILRSWGLEPVIGPNVGKIYKGKYAGTVQERVEDLRWALRDTSIKAILCNRGGYGSIDFVNELGAKDFSEHPKWLVGFSDITTLHGMETRAGVMSIHGTMGAIMVKTKGEDVSSLLVKDILMGTLPQYVLPTDSFSIPGKATGILVGGNMCTFSPFLGTWADATAGKDIILFMEEVEEDMSHIDRIMNTLILNGVLDRCKGVILGEFTDCEANLDYSCVEEMLCSYLKDYNIPVLTSFPSGHGDVNLPLLMGAQVSIEVGPEQSSVTFLAKGRQQEVYADYAEESTDVLNNVLNESGTRLERAYNFYKYFQGKKK